MSAKQAGLSVPFRTVNVRRPYVLTFPEDARWRPTLKAASGRTISNDPVPCRLGGPAHAPRDADSPLEGPVRSEPVSEIGLTRVILDDNKQVSAWIKLAETQILVRIGG